MTEPGSRILTGCAPAGNSTWMLFGEQRRTCRDDVWVWVWLVLSLSRMRMPSDKRLFASACVVAWANMNTATWAKRELCPVSYSYVLSASVKGLCKMKT